MWRLIKIDSLPFVPKSRTLHCSHGNLPYLTLNVKHVASPPLIHKYSLGLSFGLCVSSSLLIVMLMVRNAKGTPPTGFTHSMSSTDISHPYHHLQSLCPGWASPCGYYNLRMHFSKKRSGNLEKQDLLQIPGGYTAHPRTTQEIRRREKRREYKPGTLCLLGFKGRVSRVLWVCSFWWM